METIRSVEFVRGAASWSGLIDDGRPEVAFIGRSNVGKSSLLNMLVGRKAIARTSNTPGKTRELNFYLVDDAFYLVDLPGFGYAKVSKTERARWGALIGRYLTEREPLRLALHLVDSRHPPTTLDEDVMDLMRGSPVPYLIVLTKADKLSANKQRQSIIQTERALRARGLEAPVVLTSAQTKAGREEIWDWIRTMVV